MEKVIHDVFISYSRKDYVDEQGNVLPDNILSKIKKALKENGISYWFDKEGIYSGDEFASVLTRAIRESSVFLFVSSANSNSSRWTSNEISTALEFKKKIIPFRIDNSPYNDSVMMKIISFDYIDCKDEQKAINKLLRAVKHNLPSIPGSKSHWRNIDVPEGARGTVVAFNVGGKWEEHVFTVNSTIKKDEIYDVFISYYRNTGLQLAKSIHQLLTKEGYTVFFNEDSVREGLVDENILIHVKRCRDFILIIDTQFAKKMFCQENDWVNTELSEAIKRGNGIVNIIPILLQPDLSLSNDIFINYDKLFFQEPITVFDLIGNGDMLFERLISNRTYVNEKNAKRTIVNCDYSTNAEQTIQQMTNNPLFTAFVQLVKSSENI